MVNKIVRASLHRTNLGRLLGDRRRGGSVRSNQRRGRAYVYTAERAQLYRAKQRRCGLCLFQLWNALDAERVGERPRERLRFDSRTRAEERDRTNEETSWP